MNKLLTIASVAVISTAAAQANAATYAVSGNFVNDAVNTNVPNLMISLGGPNILDPGSNLEFGGTIQSDGSNITGGTVTATGTQTMNPTGTPITITMNMAGTASDAGVLFNSGTICVTAVAACDTGLIDVSVDNIDFTSAGSWGYNSVAGLQLDGTQTAPVYTVTQPGRPPVSALNSSAVGGVFLLGNAAGIFIAGDLTFTEVAEVPVPAAAWLFGSGLLGLAGVARRRKA